MDLPHAIRNLLDLKGVLRTGGVDQNPSTQWLHDDFLVTSRFPIEEDEATIRKFILIGIQEYHSSIFGENITLLEQRTDTNIQEERKYM